MRRLLRFSFLARITILLLGSLIAMQILLVMGYYIQRANDTGSRVDLPFPDQVSAAAELLEKAPPAQRTLILRALNSTRMRVRLSAERPEPGEDWRFMPIVTRMLSNHMTPPRSRNVSVYVSKKHGLLATGQVRRFLVTAALQSGDYVIIEAGSPLASLFGFPPGFWAGVIGFGVTIFAILLIRREARPLRRLAEAAGRFDLTHPLPVADFPRSAPEIRAVISAFNRMQERIAGLIRSRMELVGAFSHDVRTYVTRLRLRAELIPDEAERARAVRDIEDMTSFVDDALLAIQDKPGEARQELINVAELVQEQIEDQRRQGTQASFTCSMTKGGAITLGDAAGLRRVFRNLIENAITYGGEARAHVAAEADRICMTIDDNGPGIPPEWRTRVLQPFVRMEQSRSRRTGGAGLGLAIARNIVEAHEGRLVIGDAPGRGARITVELPLFRPVS